MLAKSIRKHVQEDEPIVYSAAIAFFTIFSLPAILVVLTFIGSIFFAGDAVMKEIVSEADDLISPNAAGQVRSVLENLSQLKLGFWQVLIGTVIVTQSSSIVFFMMQKALNSVWKIRINPEAKFLRVLKYRLMAFAVVLGLGLLLVLSMMFDTAMAVLNEQLQSFFESYFTPAIRTINILFYLTVVLVFFTAIHKVLPDAKIAWKDAWAGGIITSVLFLFGKQIINYFLGNIRIVDIYAAAGSIVVVMLWVFYSSLIFVLGAVITKAYANIHGREVEPTAIALKYDQLSRNERKHT